MTLSPVRKTSEALNVTIANGASISAGDNLNGRTVTGIYMPAGWTAAGITFQVSNDGVTWSNLFGAAAELALTSAAAGVYIAVDPLSFLGVSWLRVRSGTAGTPVVQAAQRDLVVMCGAPLNVF